jgi:hypothetical protein
MHELKGTMRHRTGFVHGQHILWNFSIWNYLLKIVLLTLNHYIRLVFISFAQGNYRILSHLIFVLFKALEIVLIITRAVFLGKILRLIKNSWFKVWPNAFCYLARQWPINLLFLKDLNRSVLRPVWSRFIECSTRF